MLSVQEHYALERVLAKWGDFPEPGVEARLKRKSQMRFIPAFRSGTPIDACSRQNGQGWNKSFLANLIYVYLAGFFLVYVVSLDRTVILDNKEYVDYFEVPGWDFYFKQWNETEGYLSKFAFLFSEEAVWRAYIVVVGWFLSPDTAVLFTVVLLNLLLALSFVKLDKPLVALMLWIILPYGLAVTGIVQIRQGFAFAVFAYLAVVLSRPLLGALLAAMIHTTFIVPLLYVSLYILFRRKIWLAVLCSVIVSVLAAYFSSMAFGEFGGRRLVAYSAEEGTDNINYVIAAFLWVLPTLYITWKYRHNTGVYGAIWVAHIGIVAWITACFFLFPLGTSRTGYFMGLFAIFSVASFWRFRDKILLFYYPFLLIATLRMISNGIKDGLYDGLLQ